MKKLEDQLLIKFTSSYPEHAINMMSRFSVDEILSTLVGLPIYFIAEVIGKLPPQLASLVLVSMDENNFLKLYRALDPIRSAHLLSLTNEDQIKAKSLMLTDYEKKDLEDLLKYPEDSAGALMDTSIRACNVNSSVKEVISSYKKMHSNSRDIFVTDIEGRLVGYVPVHDLLSSESNQIIESIMHRAPPSVNALSPKAEVVETFENFKSTILPVTHIDGTLLGAIRYSSLVTEMQKQAISRMATLGGASVAEKVMSPPIISVGKRLPWLLINLLTAFIASAVVGVFEGTIAKVTALAVLLPVVAGQSGNTGAQAMAVTMRGLALREVRVRQWIKILFKELRVGFVNGIVIAIVTGASVYFWSKSMPLGLVMTAAMVFSMITASISGAAIPMILTAMGKDPAQSSSVILTTVTDVMGFLSFLGLATLFVKLLI